MSQRIQKHKDNLTEARQHLESVLNGVGTRWDETLYSDGARWTIRQLLIHLMIADKGLNRVMQGIAEDQQIIPEDYDIDRYNRRSVEKSAEITVEQARAGLAQSRQELFDWLDSIDEDTLDKEGRHPARIIMPIHQMLDIMAQHERDHADDIARYLAG